jgi:PleD family two-component response regulator
VSVGWTAWRPGDDLDSLLRRADAALYRARTTRDAVAGDEPPP